MFDHTGEGLRHAFKYIRLDIWLIPVCDAEGDCWVDAGCDDQTSPYERDIRSLDRGLGISVVTLLTDEVVAEILSRW